MRRLKLCCLAILCVLLSVVGAHAQARAETPSLDPSVWAKGFRKLPSAVMTEPGGLPYVQIAGGGVGNGKAVAPERLPLKHTYVSAKITEFVAEVEVRQTYVNSAETPVEVLYIFPLPENSAVNHLHMQIGDREIEAQIKKRAEARRVYEQAKQRGHTAALLEQERPNIFTQSVANIPGKAEIEIVVRYVQDLTYDNGWYEFVFPMVVGPRYMPGDPLVGGAAGAGAHVDTTQVPDASRISPPYVGRGTRSGHDISLELVASAGQALSDISVPTHQIVKQSLPDGSLKLALKDQASVPNRDFVLRYRVADKQPRATLFTSDDSGAGYFSLVIQPPAVDVDHFVGQRELIFVVDVSGSMSGLPLSLCREAITTALAGMRPQDTFNVITFASSTQQLFASPQPVNEMTRRLAQAFVGDMRAGGGTEMSKGIAAALAPQLTPGRHRYVFFLTDGYVGNEAALIEQGKRFSAAANDAGSKARVFAMGVGSSPNRHLIDGLSRAGRGVATYTSSREDPAGAVNRFYHVIDQAILTDLNIEWGGMNPSHVSPSQVPDLFASHALILHGQYSAPPTEPLSVSAEVGGKRITLPVNHADTALGARASQVLGSLWARGKIEDFEELLRSGENRVQAERQITKLGLEFALVTRFTSFVAVDQSRVVSGPLSTVAQALDAPEGVDIRAAGGQLEFDSDPLSSPPSPTGASMSEMEVESRRGCGCQLPGRGGGGRAGWLLGFGLILAGLRRSQRKARRRAARQ